MKMKERIQHAWSAFKGKDYTRYVYYGNGVKPTPINYYNNSSSLISIYNKIAIDVSEITIRHVRLDKDGQYSDTVYDELNNLFNLEANIDETGRDLIRHAVLTMLNDGPVAFVPTRTDVDPLISDSYKVLETRVGRVREILPYDVVVDVYNVDKGMEEQIILPKRICPVIENPFYSVMNLPNTTNRRLNSILNLIDRQNKDSSSGKWNLIIQTPFAMANKKNEELAKKRQKEIEEQLNNSAHGVAYLDANEKITQLNRSIESNLYEQEEKLKTELYNQLGVSREVFDGTANEQQNLNYYNRVIYPIIRSIVQGIERRWLSKTARTQGHSIYFFREPFSNTPITSMTDTFDVMKSNEIMTSNECRSILGLKPINTDRANELINASINVQENVSEEKTTEVDEEIQNE